MCYSLTCFLILLNLNGTLLHNTGHITTTERANGPWHDTQTQSFCLCTAYRAEVLLVLTESLHLWGVQNRHIVRHALLSVLFVLFLSIMQ